MTARPWHPPTLRAEQAEVRITPQQADVLAGLCFGVGDNPGRFTEKPRKEAA